MPRSGSSKAAVVDLPSSSLPSFTSAGRSMANRPRATSLGPSTGSAWASTLTFGATATGVDAGGGADGWHAETPSTAAIALLPVLHRIIVLAPTSAAEPGWGDLPSATRPAGARRIVARMSYPRRVLFPLVLFQAACASLPAQAGDTFARQESCPKASVTVTEQRNFRVAELYESFCRRGFACPRTPPADVAESPERLKVWEENHDKQVVAYAANLVDGRTVFAVNGCGAHRTFACSAADCRELDLGEAAKP